MASDIEKHRQRVQAWVKRQASNSEVLTWLAANAPPASWNRDALEWAYYQAPESLLAKWATFVDGTSDSATPQPPPADITANAATVAAPALAPLAAEPPPTPTLQAVLGVPAAQDAPAPLTPEALAAAELIKPKVTWFPAARKGEPPVPLVKMPGSKRWLCPAIQDTVTQYLEQTEGVFIEPFAGSAALSLAIGARGCKIVIADANPDLMRILAAVKASPEDYWSALEQWVEQGVGETDYLAARGFTPTTQFSLAVRALYLARLAYNGLWRVNSKGEFNVPYGRSPTRAFPSLEAMFAVSAALKQSEIFYADFRQIIPRAVPGDVLLLDPPYIGTFTAYTAQGFSEQDTAETAQLAKQAAERGVAVIVTSPQDPAVARHYEWAYNVAIAKKHIVAAKATARRAYPEAIYTNEPDLIALGALNAYLEETAASEPEAEADTEEESAASL